MLKFKVDHGKGGRYAPVTVTCALTGKRFSVPMYRLHNAANADEARFYKDRATRRRALQMANGFPPGDECLVVKPKPCCRPRFKRGLCRTHEREFRRGRGGSYTLKKFDAARLRKAWENSVSYMIRDGVRTPIRPRGRRTA